MGPLFGPPVSSTIEATRDFLLHDRQHIITRAARVVAIFSSSASTGLRRACRGGPGSDVPLEYLDEFAFRFNRRKSRSRGKLFYRVAQQAVAIAPTTYREIVDSNNSRKPRHHNPLGLPESTG